MVYVNMSINIHGVCVTRKSRREGNISLETTGVRSGYPVRLTQKTPKDRLEWGRGVAHRYCVSDG